MVVFHSYVSLPEGTSKLQQPRGLKNPRLTFHRVSHVEPVILIALESLPLLGTHSWIVFSLQTTELAIVVGLSSHHIPIIHSTETRYDEVDIYIYIAA